MVLNKSVKLVNLFDQLKYQTSQNLIYKDKGWLAFVLCNCKKMYTENTTET